MKLTKSMLILSAITALSLSCSKKNPSDPPSPAVEKAKELTEKAYDLKLTGHNGKALALFEKIHDSLASALGKNSREVASNLDDQASIYMRTGDFKKAKELFERAYSMLEKLGKGENLRLLAGIDRRLEIIEAMERRGLTCSEPLYPAETRDAGAKADALSYFPRVEQVQAVFAKMNQRLNGCLKGAPRPVTLRMVITGQGEIVLAEARGPYYGSDQGRCISDKLMAASPEFAAEIPHFKACFRNFTYPFIVGE